MPHVLVFNCVSALGIGQGGETIFTNTVMLLEKTPGFLREDWSKVTLTYETEKVAHYGGKFSTPLISYHPLTKRRVLRYAEPVTTKLNPVSLSVQGVSADEAKQLCDYLDVRIYQPDVCYEHQLQAGDWLLADNHALMHGRRALRDGGDRHIQRLQLK